MTKNLLVLTVLLSACSSGALDTGGLANRDVRVAEAQRLTLSQVATRGDASEFSGVCAEALSFAQLLDDDTTFSVFKRFNSYPPVAPLRSPGDGPMPTVEEDVHGLLSCVPDGAIKFSILGDGRLVEGTRKDLYPLGVFRSPEGAYLAVYMHKNYEVGDGEGEVVEASGLLLDPSGEVFGVIQGLSSWYEYEGSIRIRDFLYKSGRAMTTERVYDPVARDEFGNSLGYINTGGSEVVKEHRIEIPGT